MSTSPFLLVWRPADDRQRRLHNDLPVAAEWGAYGIAILVVTELTGKVVIERSRKGSGFDFWFGTEVDEHAHPFTKELRLEVSGILVGTEKDINDRVGAKKHQISPTDTLAPGCVAVVEFSRPVAHVEMK